MKSNCRSRLLLDVGGTFIKCSDGRQIPIDSDGSFESISLSLSSAVSDFCRDDKEKGKSIAVAIPGPFDYNEGRFLMTHKFASVYGRLFRDIAGIPDSTELLFCHDVVAMLKGEMIGGYGAGFDRVALITLGRSGLFRVHRRGNPSETAGLALNQHLCKALCRWNP